MSLLLGGRLMVRPRDRIERVAVVADQTDPVGDQDVPADFDQRPDGDRHLIADVRPVSDVERGLLLDGRADEGGDAVQRHVVADINIKLPFNPGYPIYQAKAIPHLPADAFKERLIVENPLQVVTESPPRFPFIIEETMKRGNGRRLDAADSNGQLVEAVIEDPFSPPNLHRQLL